MDIAVIARFAGERDPSCTMPVPSPMRSVPAARYASGVIASNPQDSPDQIDSAPSRSASRANSVALFQSPGTLDVRFTAIFMAVPVPVY